MTNNSSAISSTISQFTSEFIVDDQEEEVSSPVPQSIAEPYGGIPQDYREDTVFVLDIEADAKQPGTLTGEQCPISDIMNNSYDYLSSQYPYWRRILSDDYMRNTALDNTTIATPPAKSTQLVLLHIDDHAWASVVHYLTASKFLQSPQIYTKLCLDSCDATSQLPASQIRILRQKLPITEEARKDWHDNRKIDAWRRALLAKFAQNDDLQRALILTGWAKLVDKNGQPQHLLMWVRAVLRGEQQTVKDQAITTPTALKVKDDKHLEEALRVIEGLFGKDKQHMLASILSGDVSLDSLKEELETKVVEAKPVEMKDAVGYLEQIKADEPPQTYNKFLEIMTDFRSEKINTPQVLERVTLLFKGKPWLIRNFLMFLPPGHILDLSPENKSDSIYITSPNGSKIIINTVEGAVTFE
ncbi:unnamed protein product [Mucor circinelloides]|uniref:Uncharacterized protein n=1 Tax=Mucor circinelloides f. circinelloides (strain 1006PhL) TaxID=1220926 RepID=S2JKE6_MUCC1|nr:hypothetical protein HMPREF1544_02755 [Mucor circinelloides 1006PhL]